MVISLALLSLAPCPSHHATQHAGGPTAPRPATRTIRPPRAPLGASSPASTPPRPTLRPHPRRRPPVTRVRNRSAHRLPTRGRSPSARRLPTYPYLRPHPLPVGEPEGLPLPRALLRRAGRPPAYATSRNGAQRAQAAPRGPGPGRPSYRYLAPSPIVSGPYPSALPYLPPFRRVRRLVSRPD